MFARAVATTLMLLTCGCGRLGFDPLGEGPAPGGPLVVEPLYPAAPAWNDYIRYDANLSLAAQTGTPCDGSETGLGACIHAGELRRVIAPGLASCDGSSARDELYAFRWQCDDASSPVAFYTTGLAPGRGLGDLVDASGWRPNHVIINGFAGEPGIWWDNPVEPLPLASGSISTLATPRAIYTAGTQPTDRVRVDADHVALVVLPGETLRFGSATAGPCGTMFSTGTCVVDATARQFTWIEGALDARGLDRADDGLNLEGSAHARVHRASITDAAAHALIAIDARNFRVTDASLVGASTAGFFVPLSRDFELERVRAANNGYGVMLSDLDGAFAVRDVTTAHNTSDGLLLFNGNNGTIRDVVTTHNAGNGVFLVSSNATFAHVISAHNGWDGIRAEPGGTPTMSHVLTVRNAGSGLAVAGGGGRYVQLVAALNGLDGVSISATAATTELSHVALVNNGGTGLRIDSAPSCQLHGPLLLGDNTGGPCAVTGATCATVACAPAGASTASVVTSGGAAMAFAGSVSADEANASDQDGVGPVDTLDWFSFENPYRTWAPADPVSGPCTGTCQIVDWRLVASDTTLVGRSFDGVTDSGPFEGGAPCPPAVDGDRVPATGSPSFLINAFEIGNGDGDGLCETGEKCTYSPNFGPYQGTGDIATLGSCTFADGAVTGVKMYARPERAL